MGMCLGEWIGDGGLDGELSIMRFEGTVGFGRC